MVTALLVTSAATLLESAPFILAAVLLTRPALRWSARIDAYLGCGCGAGPSARSLPAAAATCLVFGPLVAGARLAAAILVARSFAQADRGCSHARGGAILSELHAIAPFAVLGALTSLLLPLTAGMYAPPAFAFAGGALAAFIVAPCALGAVGLAAATRSVMPAAAAGFLCIAGIVDIRALLRRSPESNTHDGFAYAIFALACAVVAAHGGTGLVHPKIALALWPCALAGAAGAYRFKGERRIELRIAPAVMLAGAMLAAPPPAYHATETTLADAFAGERVDFTGVLTRTGNATTLVRYAITCCRADAAPIVVRLTDAPSSVRGWVRARGTMIARGSELELRAANLRRIDPPADPFVYR